MKGNLETQSGARIDASVFEHLRYRRMVSRRWRLESFIQHEYDEDRRLALRALAGGGIRFEVSAFDGGLFAVGVASMVEWERLRDGNEPDAGDESVVNRLSTYLSTEFSLAERVELKQTLFYQPKITSFADARALNETSFVLTVTERVQIPITYTLRYDSEPPDGVVSTDARLHTSVVFRF